MQKKLLGFIFLISINCFSQEYFEGELNYNIEYESNNESISTNFLKKEFGVSFTAYVKEDKYAMIYYGKGQKGWMKVIVRLDEGFKYTEFEKSDTIVKTKFGKEKNDLISFKQNTDEKKEILGTECESITIEYEEGDSDSFIKEVRGKYYFDPKYKLNSALYSKYTDGFWNLYVKESESVSIRNEVEFYPLFKSIQEVTSIVEKKIDNTMFEPNKEKIIKIEE